MANLFEKPIAANPMSQFVALPLDYLDKSIQRKQAAYDQNKASAFDIEDTLLKTNALTRDKPRQQAIIQGFNDKIDEIVDSSGGDYSRIAGQVDALKRDMNRELSSNGELGAINANYTAGIADKLNLEKRYAAGNAQAAGMEFGLSKLGEHQTTRGADGSWSSYKGYVPSNIVDPVGEIRDGIKSLHAKWDEEGTESRKDSDIISNISASIESNPDIEKSLMENFKKSKPGGSEDEYRKWRAALLTKVVDEASYEKFTKTKIDGKTGMIKPGTTLQNFQQPQRMTGTSDRTGGNVALGRAGLKLFGVNTTEDHDNFIKTEEGKRMIKQMENITGSMMPQGYYAQTQWFEDNMTPRVSNIIVDPIEPAEAKMVMTTDGWLNHKGASYGQDGVLESDEQQEAWMGKTKDGPTARVIGKVRHGDGYLPGSYVVMGADNKQHIVESKNPDILASNDFNIAQIESVSRTPTGRLEVNIQGTITEEGTKKPLVPMGIYDARYNPETGITDLYQNGVKKYSRLPDGRIGTPKAK